MLSHWGPVRKLLKPVNTGSQKHAEKIPDPVVTYMISCTRTRSNQKNHAAKP